MPRKLDPKFNKSIEYYKTILVLTTDQKHPRKTGKVVQNKKRLIVPEFVAKPGKALEDAAKAARVTTRSLVPPSPIISPISPTPPSRGPLKITLKINASSSSFSSGPSSSSSSASSSCSSATSSPITTPENSPNKPRRIILKTREQAAADILLSLGQGAGDDVEMADDDTLSSAALLMSLLQPRSKRSTSEDGEGGTMDLDQSGEEEEAEEEDEEEEEDDDVDTSSVSPARGPRAGTLSVLDIRRLEGKPGLPSVTVQSPGRRRYRVGKASTSNMPGMSLHAPYIDSYANGDYVTPHLSRR